MQTDLANTLVHKVCLFTLSLPYSFYASILLRFYAFKLAAPFPRERAASGLSISSPRVPYQSGP